MNTTAKKTKKNASVGRTGKGTENSENNSTTILAPKTEKVKIFRPEVKYPLVTDLKTGVRIEPVIENTEAFLASRKINIHYDEIKNFVFINGERIEDTKITYICSEMIYTGYKLKEDILRKHILYIATKNRINPVRDYFNDLLKEPYYQDENGEDICKYLKGKEEFSRWVDALELNYQGFNKSDLKNFTIEAMLKWSMNAVRMAFNTEEKNYNFREIVVFQSNQKSGKSEFIIRSVPPALQNYCKESMSINPENRDDVVRCNSYWIFELAEFDTMSKRDQGRLKAWVSNGQDVERKAYGYFDSFFTRKFMPYATVNNPEFLTDKTGNTRYMVIPIESINREITNNINHELLWFYIAKNAMESMKEKIRTVTIDPALMEFQQKINEAHEVMNEIEIQLDRIFDWESPFRNNELSGTEIAGMCKVKSTKGLREALKKHEVEQKKSGSRRFYPMPPTKEDVYL